MSRPIWQRIVDPDEPLLWAKRLAVVAMILSLTSMAIVLIWA